MANANTIKIDGKKYRLSLNDKGAESVPFIEIATITPVGKEGQHKAELTLFTPESGLYQTELELGPRQTAQLKDQLAEARMASLFKEKPVKNERMAVPHSDVFLRRDRVVSMQPHPMNTRMAKLSLVTGVCETNNNPCIPMPRDMTLATLAKQFPKLKPEGHNHSEMLEVARVDDDSVTMPNDDYVYINPSHIAMAVSTASAEYPTRVTLKSGANVYSDLKPEQLIPEEDRISFNTSTSKMGAIRPSLVRSIGFAPIESTLSPVGEACNVTFDGNDKQVRVEAPKPWLQGELKKRHAKVIDRHPAR